MAVCELRRFNDLIITPSSTGSVAASSTLLAPSSSNESVTSTISEISVTTTSDVLDIPQDGTGAILASYSIAPTGNGVDISDIGFNVKYDPSVDHFQMQNIRLYSFLSPSGNNPITWYTPAGQGSADQGGYFGGMSFYLSPFTYPMQPFTPIHVSSGSALVVELIGDIAPGTPGVYQSPFSLSDVSLSYVSSSVPYILNKYLTNDILGENINIVTSTAPSEYSTIAHFQLDPSSPSLDDEGVAMRGQEDPVAIIDMTAPTDKDLGINGMDIHVVSDNTINGDDGSLGSAPIDPTTDISDLELWDGNKLIGTTGVATSGDVFSTGWAQFRNIYYVVPQGQTKQLTVTADITSQSQLNDELSFTLDNSHIYTFGDSSSDVIPISGSIYSRSYVFPAGSLGSLAIIAPKQDAIISPGSSFNIQWQFTDPPTAYNPENDNEPLVSLYLVNGDYSQGIGTGDISGDYEWEVPDALPAGKYQLLLKAKQWLNVIASSEVSIVISN
jgi:hypothetical protein